jgi:hypothetical protein
MESLPPIKPEEVLQPLHCPNQALWSGGRYSGVVTMTRTRTWGFGLSLILSFTLVSLGADDPVTPPAPALPQVDVHSGDYGAAETNTSEPIRWSLEDKSKPVRYSFEDKSEANNEPVRLSLEDKEKPVRLKIADDSQSQDGAADSEAGPIRKRISDMVVPVRFELSYGNRHKGIDLLGYMKKKKKGMDGWLHTSGWIDMGYTFSFNSPLDFSNLPLGFNDQANEFQMNQLYLIFNTKKWTFKNEAWSLTGRADVLYGTDHFYTTAAGLETRLDGSPHWNSVDLTNVKRLNSAGPAPYYGVAMPQAYVDLETPLVNGLDIRLGHFYSPLGSESVMASENFFYSHTYSRVYGKPFTHTGLLASKDILDGGLRLTGGFTRGWDNFEDADDDLSILAGLAFELEGHSFALNVHTGDDHPYLDNGGTPQLGNITVTTLKYSRKLGEKATYSMQGDLGYGEAMEAHNSTGTLSEARWYGITNQLIYDFSEKVSGGLRVEWFRDQDNARVLGIAVDEEVDGGNYVDITTGINLRPNDRWVIRSELRWDWSDVTSDIFAVDGMFNGSSKRDQFTFTMDAIYSF